MDPLIEAINLLDSSDLDDRELALRVISEVRNIVPSEVGSKVNSEIISENQFDYSLFCYLYLVCPNEIITLLLIFTAKSAEELNNAIELYKFCLPAFDKEREFSWTQI